MAGPRSKDIPEKDQPEGREEKHIADSFQSFIDSETKKDSKETESLIDWESVSVSQLANNKPSDASCKKKKWKGKVTVSFS